ncbi:MAG: sulfatase-like hydrolase/transferase [Actinomycetia bacterium]|nr:sulfatase-like hydrolase/transferase [Actinomycetes bacterium]
MTPSPNVLLIITDQHRASHTGFGGDPTVETPHLDALAARSVVFDNAYVANPICMPNRSTIMTGRMPSVHGTRYNGIPLDWRANTFVRRLRAQGYRTGLIGKSHLQNMGHRPPAFMTANDMSLPEEAVLLDLPEGWDAYEQAHRYNAESVAVVPDFYGFDHVEFAVDHGDLCSGHYRRWLADQGVDWESLQREERHPINDPTHPHWYRTEMPVELYPTTWVGDRSVAFIEEASAAGTPWMLQCSFPDPHHPFTPPGAYADRYGPADVELPASFAADHTNLMPHVARMLEQRGSWSGMSPWAVTEQQFREAAAYQYGAISLIDDTVGRVLAAVEHSGQANDTIMVFTADHGDMMGDHGLLMKMNVHYEAVTRVPYTIAGPGITPGRTSSLAGSLDLAPTILDLAGIEAFHGLQGHSLRPVLDDPAATVRDHVLIEEDSKRDMVGGPVPTRMRTIVTADARLTRYQGLDQAELYDHGADPLELNNGWGTNRALEREMSERLVQSLMAHADPGQRPKDLA